MDFIVDCILAYIYFSDVQLLRLFAFLHVTLARKEWFS